MTLKVNPVTLILYSSPEGRYHNPQRRRRCRPLSEANTTLLHNPRRSRAPFFLKSAPEGRHHHPLNPLNLLNLLNPGRLAALLSYPHFVQNPVKYFSISQEIHRKSQALWEK